MDYCHGNEGTTASHQQGYNNNNHSFYGSILSSFYTITMSSNNNNSLWTRDPFSDGGILEEQPEGYAPERDDQDSTITATNLSNPFEEYQGTGALVPWTPGHNRRRSSLTHASYVTS